MEIMPFLFKLYLAMGIVFTLLTINEIKDIPEFIGHILFWFVWAGSKIYRRL